MYGSHRKRRNAIYGYKKQKGMWDTKVRYIAIVRPHSFPGTIIIIQERECKCCNDSTQGRIQDL